MTWNAFRTRGEILREVAAVADARLDGVLPLDVPGVRERFDDELDLLGALQLRWHTRLSGHLERALADQPLDLAGAAVTAWRAAAEELPGVRAVLDHHREHPVDDRTARALRVATEKERALLAVTAGRAGLADARATHVGAELEREARRILTAPAA